MTTEATPPSVGAVLRDALRDSYLVILTFVVMFVGVGRMSALAGLDAVQTALMTLLTVAAPAQAAAMSILAAGSGGGTAWIAAVTSVVVINLRFIVMVASVMARLPRLSVPRSVATLGFLSASSFAVIFPRMIGEAPPRRPALYVGLTCLCCALSATAGAVIGHRSSGAVSPLAGALLGAVVPTYFATLIAGQWKDKALMRNAFAGAVLVPLAAPLLGPSALLLVPLAFAVVTTLVQRRKSHA